MGNRLCAALRARFRRLRCAYGRCSTAGPVEAALERSFPPTAPFRVTHPAAGTVWRAGGHHSVIWSLDGIVRHPVDVLLVYEDCWRITEVAVLAEGIGPQQRQAAFTVPPVPPGTYLVLLTTGDPADALSAPITVLAARA
ncbi:hypothetical protein ABT160_35820 [Streptomyces sp. NPDC001941]|uniref:hypothetical protein n=1 Tax=Streptomyces sp. NPDC001941 TaxID=3154659 RepID=UPI00331F3134